MNHKESNENHTNIGQESVSKITIRLTKEEKNLLSQKAACANKSMNAFLIDAVMQTEPSCKHEAFLQAQRLIKLQRQIDEIEDRMQKDCLREECAKVWHGFASLTNGENTTMMLH